MRAGRPRRVVAAHVPTEIEAPEEMLMAVALVLRGEYEAGYSGEQLTILDVGANVGSFSMWAAMRWPGSTIHAYEPNPDTYAMLCRNVAGLANVTSINVAVYPTEACELTFFSRFPGDGEAGIATVMARTFRDVKEELTFPVPALHPRELPRADVIKLDVEGAEGEILAEIDLEATSLVLTEFQNLTSRRAMEQAVGQDFELVYEDAVDWDCLLANSEYREELRGDRCGHLFFVRRNLARMRRVGPPRPDLR